MKNKFYLIHLSGKRIPVEKDLILGRTKGHIKIGTDNRLSSSHAKFIIKDEKLFLVDLKSTNGSFINSLKLVPGKEYELKSNAEVVVGNQKFNVEAGEPVDDKTTVLSFPEDKTTLVPQMNKNHNAKASSKENISSLSNYSNKTLKNLSFKFEGEGIEYFFIFIVNIVLSVLTLGIFSPWAKVRSKRYFYGNTFLGKDSFEYHASPIQILKGRLLIVGIFMAISIGSKFIPELALITPILLLVAPPWLIVKGVSFARSNTSFKSVHFSFEKNYAHAYKTYFLAIFSLIITFGLAIPYAIYLLQNFLTQNTKYGNLSFNLNCNPFDYVATFYKSILKYALYAALFLGVIAAAYFIFGKNTPAYFVALFIGLFGAILCQMKGSVVVISQLKKLRWSKTELGEIQFKSKLDDGKYFNTVIYNRMLDSLSFGLHFPVGRVKIHHLLTSSTSVTFQQDYMDQIVNENLEDEGSVADAALDFWDFDIGF